MNIQVAGFNDSSIVDGFGIRFTIFVQGCPNHCEGCHNKETWDFNAGTTYDCDDILKKLKDIPYEGITLSGGEPFCQQEACKYIADKAHEMGMNVWSYTGFTYEELKRKGSLLLPSVDVLVDGRFEQSKRSLDFRFRGSSNQRVIDVGRSTEYQVVELIK